MSAEKSVTEKILHVLRPYASNWSGTLGRGDLVIPQREIPRVIHEILDAVHELTDVHREAPEGEIFQALMESRRAALGAGSAERAPQAFPHRVALGRRRLIASR